MMSGASGAIGRSDLIVVGGAGAQGLALVRYVHQVRPDLAIRVLDRHVPPAAQRDLNHLGVEAEHIDVLSAGDRLPLALQGAQLVVNMAGPFFRLGTVILRAAIQSRVAYIDICDDADATEALLDQDAAAKAAGVSALVGMGAAPGVTNILVRLGHDALIARTGQPGLALRASIDWTAPASDMTAGIFEHFVHGLRTALPGQRRVPSWTELEPKQVPFPDPLGDVQTIRIGHPEPLTLSRTLGCSCDMRGGITPDAVLYRAWEAARVADSRDFTQGDVADAWRSLQGFIDGLGQQVSAVSGMRVDVWLGNQGIRFESATTISMEQSTAVPAAAASLLMLEGRMLKPGVWPPECLDPLDFFTAAGRVSPGGGGLTASWLSSADPPQRMRLRDILKPPAG